MPYKLTLTKAERAAFDWIGYRYCTGHEVSKLLIETLEDDTEWDTREDITFSIPEYIAWGIAECSKQENDFWPCFSDELKTKMINFCMEIV